MMSIRHIPKMLVLCAGIISIPSYAVDIADVTISNRTAGAKTDIPVTFGQPFEQGDVPSGQILAARRSAANGSTMLPIQQDIKTTYGDGSVRYAVLTFILPTLADGGSETLTIATHTTAPSGSPVNALPGGFTASVSTGGGSASAHTLNTGTSQKWLEGPLVTEWLSNSALTSSLEARFEVRVYNSTAGNRVRVSVAVENIWAPGSSSTQTYNATVMVNSNTVLSQTNVPHYRQSRWRRVFWTNDPGIHIAHDAEYLMQTGAVPTYDSSVNINASALNEILDEFDDEPNLMQVGGGLDKYMPSPGGRMEIAPFPRFTAMYLMTQDVRGKQTTLGYGEQAGSWPIHYRDPSTDRPISLADYPNITVLGTSSNPSTCETCGSPFTPDVAHHASLAYVPYLVTGDFFFLEELQFWANYAMFYYGSHGNSQGLIVYDQVRAQAWGLRDLAEAAWATPDSDSMKSYFTTRLNNNINFYINNRMTQNNLGFVIREISPGEIINQISSWQDDFLTWTFGHVVDLGFSNAQSLLQWKAQYVVGRMTNSATCWILASANWPYMFAENSSLYEQWAGDMTATERANHVDVQTWADYQNNLVWGWRQTVTPSGVNLSGDETTLIGYTEASGNCNSPAMAAILERSQSYMIGFQGESWQGYPANMQPALATAINAGTPNADLAFSKYAASDSFPDFEDNPQYAIVANGPFTPVPVPPPPVGSSSSSSGGSGGSSSSSSGGDDSDSPFGDGDGGGLLHPIILLFLLTLCGIARRKQIFAGTK